MLANKGYVYSLWQGSNMTCEFGSAEEALAWMADQADRKLGHDFALMVFDGEGMCQIALVDAREAHQRDALILAANSARVLLERHRDTRPMNDLLTTALAELDAVLPAVWRPVYDYSLKSTGYYDGLGQT